MHVESTLAERCSVFEKLIVGAFVGRQIEAAKASQVAQLVAQVDRERQGHLFAAKEVCLLDSTVEEQEQLKNILQDGRLR